MGKVKTAAVLLLTVFLMFTSVKCDGFAESEETKRQSKDEVLLFNDSEDIELYYHLPADQAAVDIEVFLYVGDGPISLGDAVHVEPDETVLTMKTDASDLFSPGIYTGAIVVRDINSGLIRERVDTTIRIYDHSDDPYDCLEETNEEYELVLEEEEPARKEYYKMRLYLQEGTIMIDYSGLMAEDHTLDIDIVILEEGRELSVARVEQIGPRGLCLSSDVHTDILPLLEVGEVYEARLDAYYSDTGELFETRAGEIEVLN